MSFVGRKSEGSSITLRDVGNYRSTQHNRLGSIEDLEYLTKTTGGRKHHASDFTGQSCPPDAITVERTIAVD